MYTEDEAALRIAFLIIAAIASFGKALGTYQPDEALWWIITTICAILVIVLVIMNTDYR